MRNDATQCELAAGERVFGRYTLRKILGRGGMGIVWLARDEELERDVALKFLPELVVLDKALLNELKRETRRSLELTHKNIVRIHDFVNDQHSACISMEYIDGDTLSNLRVEKERTVFEPNELSAWTAQLCDALDYAHHHAHIVHRDLKPANLLVNRKGELKVSDFGIARSLGDSMSKLTMVSGGTSGTLVYMSPQQLDGERGSHLDDIYSLGATLYDLLTGKPPFYSGNGDKQIHERTAPSMIQRRKDFNIEPAFVPPIWEQTVAACLAKDPAQRPQSTAEVARRLGLTVVSVESARTPAPRQRFKKSLLAGATIALALVAVGSWYFTTHPKKRAANPATPNGSNAVAIADKSIAVLPFENLSKDEENAFFAGGVQDEILTNLARIADLKVIIRTSVMNYKAGTARNIREIAKALGVAHILEGSVQRASGRVRVTAQLIDARTDAHVWAEHYDRELADVFAIQSEIAQQIAAQLQAKISAGEKAAVAERPTSDLVAYDLYLRAAALMEQAALEPGKEQEQDYLQAVELLNQAIVRDPAFLLAYCRLALAHDELYFAGHDHTPARLALANSAINAAFRLKPDSGDAHLARATHFYHGYLDYDHARDELAIAARTLPNNARIFEWTGYIDRRQGRRRDAARNLERASELDPRNVRVLGGAAVTYNSMSEYGQARATLDRLIALEPNDDFHLVTRAWIDVAERADTRPLHTVIEKILRDDPASAGSLVGERLFLARAEHDPVAADRAVAALPENTGVENTGVGKGRISFSRYYVQGLVARMKGDTVAARVAFTAARAQQEGAVRARPDDGFVLCALGLIDAALGRNEEALREGRRAVELIPVAKNALDGPDVLYCYAVICAWTGERDLAIEQLETLAKIPAGPSYGVLRLDADWDPLRGDPRFEKIVASLAPKDAK